MSGFNDVFNQLDSSEPTTTNSGFNSFNKAGDKDFVPPTTNPNTDVDYLTQLDNASKGVKSSTGFNQIFSQVGSVTNSPPTDESKPGATSSFTDFVTALRPDKEHGLLANIGKAETNMVTGLGKDIAPLFTGGQPEYTSTTQVDPKTGESYQQIDNKPGATLKEDVTEFGAHPLETIGKAGSPLLAAGMAPVSPFLATLHGSAQTIGEKTAPDNATPEEIERRGNIGGAIGEAIGGVALALTPMFHGAPEVPISTFDQHMTGATQQAQSEALANLSMSAKQPWKKSDEMIQNTLAQEKPQRTPEEIQAEINTVAKDTAAPGAKEQLSTLQQELAEAKNPQLTVDRLASKPEYAGGKISDEQFQVNIAAPTQKAIDAGVPIQRIRDELSASLPSHYDDAYKQELVNRAIPPSAQNIAESAPAVAKVLGIPEQEVQAITLPEAQLNDTNSPNVVKQAMGLNADQVKAAMGNETMGVNWTKGVNQFAPLDNLNRAFARLNGIDIGRPDLLARSETAAFKNIAERENVVGVSYLGSMDGTSSGVLEIVPGQAQPKMNPDVTPYNTIITNAKNMGATEELINEARATFNASDNYANADRVAQEAIKDAQQLRQTVDRLNQEALLPENSSYSANRQLRNQIDNLKEEIAAKQKLVKSIGERQTYMTKEEVAANLTKYKDNPAVDYLIKEMSKLNDSSLQNLVSAGKIAQGDADRMRAANPHYTPAWREADDFTFDLPKNRYTGNLSDVFKRRDMSTKGKEQIDFESNQIHYLLNIAGKAQDAQVKGMMFNNLVKILDDSGWEALFREPKAKVLSALDKMQGKIYAEDIHPYDLNKFEHYDTVNFPVNGKVIQLSVKDPTLFTSISEAYRNPDSMATMLKPLTFLSRLKVNFLTKWNPAFNIRNMERAMVDHNFNTLDGKLFRNYIPGASQLKQLGQMMFNPELYNKFRQEYGLTDPLVREYQGLTTDQIVSKIKNGKQPNTILNGIDKALTGFADRGDALTRMLEYNLTYKKALADGLSEAKARDAALIAAKNIHLNFSQKGASGNFNAVVSTFPFGRAFLNALDKQTRYGLYAPKAAAIGAANIYVLYKGIQTWNNQYKDETGQPVDNKVDKRLADQYWWIRTGPNVNDVFRISNGWFGGHWGKPTDMTLALAAKTTGQFLDKVLENQSNTLLKNAQKMFPEVPMQHLTGKDVAEAWSNAITKVVTPDSFAPAVVGTFAGYMTNKNSQGTPIVPNTKDGTPASLDYFTGSTDYALVGMTKELSMKGIEISPGVAQYFARELGGAFGEGTLVAGAHMYGMMTGKNYPMPERGEIPGFSLVSGNTSDIPHEGTEAQYYAMAKKLSQVENRYAAYEKQAKQFPEYAPMAEQYRLDHANELHWANEFKANNKFLSDTKNLISKVAGSDRNHLLGYQDINPSILGDKTKRQTIDNLQIKAESHMQAVMQSVQRDMDNGNSYANDIVQTGKAYNNTPLTDMLMSIWPNGSPSKTDKKLDKSENKDYNGSNPFISDANASEGKMFEQPPAIHQEAPQAILDEQYKPGMWEKFFPNITHKVEGMYKDNIINYTIKQEGGDKFTQTPGDRGGATKFGITLATLKASNPKATVNDVQNLTEQQAKDIYTKEYWDKGQIEKMPIGVQDLVFDMNVNHGLGGSTIIIQRALNDLGANIDEDGRLGNKTLNAMSDFKPDLLRKSILDERKQWVEDIAKSDPTQAKFLPGWKARISSLDQIPPEVKEEV